MPERPSLEPGKNSWILAVPALSLLVVMIGALGFLVAVRMGGEARGGTAHIELTGSCAADARLAVAARLDDFGLEHHFVDGPADRLVLETRTPGAPDDLDALPRALAMPGRFEVWEGGQVRLDHFTEAGVQLSLAGTPVTLINLPEAFTGEGLEVRIDGEPAEIESVNGGEIMLVAPGKDARDALRTATDRVVALRHPLPCLLSPAEVRWLP